MERPGRSTPVKVSPHQLPLPARVSVATAPVSTPTTTSPTSSCWRARRRGPSVTLQYPCPFRTSWRPAAAASGGTPLTGDGALLQLRFGLLPQTAPVQTSLSLDHVLLNDGTPHSGASAGSIGVGGRDGALVVSPQRAVPPDTLSIRIEDADEDRTAAADAVEILIGDGEDSEVVEAAETGPETGSFTAPLAVVLGSPVADNGILETAIGRSLRVCYVDSLAATGTTVERCFDVAVAAGSDGRVEVTRVSQPGDTLRVRVVDADLNADPLTVEFSHVDLHNASSGDRELVLLSEVSVDDSAFTGAIVTAFTAGDSGDGILTTGGGLAVSVSYEDELSALGGVVSTVAAGDVIDLFGDADGNGLVQAFDASRVLTHVLDPFLTGRDSLAANVDSLAPSGAITPYDAALILQLRVGARKVFPVQSNGATNQPGGAAAAAKAVLDRRQLTLHRMDDYLACGRPIQRRPHSRDRRHRRRPVCR